MDDAASTPTLPEGFMLDQAPAFPPPRPKDLTPPQAKLPDGFVLDQAAPAPQAKLPDGFALDPVNAPQPPVRPPQAELDQLSAANDPLSGFKGAVTQPTDISTPLLAPLTPEQGAAEKASRLFDANKKLRDLIAAPLSDFGYSPNQNPGEAFANADLGAVSVSQEQAQAAKDKAVKQAEGEFNKLNATAAPRLNKLNDLAANAMSAAGQGVLDVAKPFGQVGAMAGYGGLQRGLTAAGNALPQPEPIRQGDLSSQVAAGLGGAAPFAVASEAGLGAKGMAAIMGLQGFGQQFEAAKKAGADDATATAAGTLGIFTGAAQALPISRLFDKATPGFSSMLANMAAKSAQGAIEFPAIQSAATIANNAIAKGLYDKDRDLFDGVKESAEAAAIVGAMLGLPAGLAHSPEGRAKIADAAQGFDWAKELGVAPDASPADVRAAFVKRAKETHPDAGGSVEAFQRVNAAYQAYKAANPPAQGNQPAPQAQPASQPEPAPQGNQPVAQIADANAGKPAPAKPPEEIAREDEILRNAGYDPAELDPSERADALKEEQKWSKASSSPSEPSSGSSPSSAPSASPGASATKSEPNTATTSSSPDSTPASPATSAPSKPTETATSTATPPTAQTDWDRRFDAFTQERDATTSNITPEQRFAGEHDLHEVLHDLVNREGYGVDENAIPKAEWAMRNNRPDIARAYADIAAKDAERLRKNWAGNENDMTRKFQAQADSLAEKLRKVADAGGTEPEAHNLDTGKNVPESQDTLNAQVKDLAEGKRAVVMFPRGTQPPADRPPHIGMIDNARGTFWYDPEKIDSEEIKAKSAEGKENELLGLGPYSKPEIDARVAAGEKPVSVVERDKDGTELRAAYGTEQTAPEQIAAMEKDKADGATVAAEPVEKTIAARKKNQAKERPPQSLVGFVRQMGGIKDPGGDLKAMDMVKRFPGLINNRTGREPDKVREAAAQAGYFGHNTDAATQQTTINHLYNALENHPHYSFFDHDRLLASEDARRAAADYDRAIDDARSDIAKTTGLDAEQLDGATLNEAARLHVEHDVPLEDAFERAALQAVEHDPKAREETASDIPWDNADDFKGSGRLPWEAENQEPPAGGAAQGGGEAAKPRAEGDQPGAQGEAVGGRAKPESAGETAPHQEGGRGQGEAVEPDAHVTKWFGDRAKAEKYITKHKIGETHQVVEAGKYRFEIHSKPKAESAMFDDANKNASENAHGDVPSSRIPLVAGDQDTLSKPEKQVVPTIRGAGDNDLSGVVGELSSVSPGGREPPVEGNDTGAHGQRQGVRTGQRPLGDAQGTGTQHAAEQSSSIPGRSPFDSGSGGKDGGVSEGARTENAKRDGRGGSADLPAPRNDDRSVRENADNLTVGEGNGAKKGDDKGTDTSRGRPGESAPSDIADPFTRALVDKILSGSSHIFPTIIHLRGFAKQFGFKGTSEGSWHKEVEEKFEHALVLASREIVKTESDPKKAFDRLVQIYNKQPRMGTRTSQSVAEQAYSTPVPLAYLASRLAGVKDAHVILEPTAGNGALLMEADPKKQVVLANELNDTRRAHLGEQGFITSDADAAAAEALDKVADRTPPDVVIANPPFGAVKEGGDSKVFNVGGWKTTQIDHAIALRALDTMKPDGRAVLIIGGIKAEDPAELARGYTGKAKREFFYHLQNGYNVTDHFTVSGDLYERQGAGWPVDVIVIDGKGKSDRPPPSANPPKLFKSWDDLKGKLDDNQARNPRPSSEETRLPVEQEPKPAGGNEPAGNDAGERGAPVGADQRQEPVPVRGEGDSGQSDGVRAERPVDDRPQRPAGERGDAERTGQHADTGGTGRVDEPPAPREKKERDLQAELEKPQVDYEPASQRGKALNTLIPRNLRESAEDSLKRIEQRHGNIDNYVAESLGYEPKDLGKYFSAEQIDALALAIDNVEKGGAFIVGDQTGIGKGRVVAGAIAYAHKKGMIPVFATEKPDLYGDMWRDLHDIGFDKKLGRPIEMFMTNSGTRVPLDEEAAEWVAEKEAAQAAGEAIPKQHGTFSKSQDTAAAAAKMQQILRALNGGGPAPISERDLPAGYRLYSPDDFKQKPDGSPSNQKMGHWGIMAPGGHSVSMADSKDDALRGFNHWQRETVPADWRGKKNPVGSYRPDVVFTTYDQMNSVKGAETDRRRFLRSIAPNAFLILDEAHNAGGQGQKPEGEDEGGGDKAPPRSKVFRDALARARAAMYSSATYAKSPKVMDLFARTDMSKAVENPTQLPGLIEKGGIPLQQVVSSMLSKAGQYLRRERSFDGVDYDLETVPVDQRAYAEFTDGLGTIFSFDRGFAGEREAIAHEMGNELGAGSGRDGGVGDTAANATAFSSIMHNAISQMILSIKAKAAAERAVQSLRAGEKPVIALSATMESFINDYIADRNLKLGDKANIDFGDVLRRYLERTRRVTFKMPDGSKKHAMIPLDKMEPGTRQAYLAAQEALKGMDFSGLPISPIDYIRNEIQKAGFSVREITGRGTMIDYSGKTPVVSQRESGEMGPSGKAISKNQFNNGKLDALILNRSGSTGISLHASEKFKDQRRRRMILVQADPNIDTHMQMLGRVHRTGQVIPPAYSHLAADIPAEARPTAILMKKMASLNANTTGARKSKFSGEAVDFMNQYGDQVVARLMAEDPELNWRLGSPVGFDDKGRAKVAEAAAKVTGRLTLLPPAEQQELLDRVSGEYKNLIERLDATGENKLEAKTVDLQAEPVSSETLKARTGDSPFQDEVRLEQMMVKAQGRAMSPDEVMSEIAEGLETELPKGATFDTFHNAIYKKAHAAADTREKSIEAATNKFVADKLASIKDEDSKKKQQSALIYGLARWIGLNKNLVPGRMVTVPVFDVPTPAIVLSVQRVSKAKNPAALSSWTAKFAVPDSARTLEVPFSQLHWEVTPPEGESGIEVKDHSFDVTTKSFADMLNNARKEGKERRAIITGNILSGFDLAKGKGQIANFTMKDGTSQPGIIMPRGFDQKKFMAERAVRFKTGEQALKFLGVKADGEITSTDGIVTVRKAQDGRRYEFDLPAAKATGGKYFADRTVRDAWDHWEKRGSRMRATVHEPIAKKILDAMMALDAVFETKENQAEAEGIVNSDNLKNASAPSGWGEAGGETDQPKLQWAEARDALDRILFETLPPDSGVTGHVLERIEPSAEGEARYGRDLTEHSSRPLGGYYKGPDAEGKIARAIGLSMEAPAGSETYIVYHEAWHAAQDLGMTTKEENRVLESPAEVARMRKAVGDAFGAAHAAGLDQSELEAHYAGMFMAAEEGRAKAPQSLTARAMDAFRRFANWMRKARNWAKRYGFTTTDEILRAFQSGDMKYRHERGPSRFLEDEGEAAAHAPRDPTKVYDSPSEKKDTKDRWARLRTNLEDLNLPAKRLGERLEGMIGRPLRDEENLYLAKRLIPGKVLAMQKHVRERFEDPIVKIAREARLSLGDIGRRLLADHVPERNAAIDELHDWRKDYGRRKDAYRLADQEATKAEYAYVAARAKEDDAAQRVEQAKGAASSTTAREIMKREPGMDAATDRALQAIDAAQAAHKQATRDSALAASRAADLRAKADEAYRHSLTPSELAAEAHARAARAEERKQEAIAEYHLLGNEARNAADEAQHLRAEADKESERAAAYPANDRQQARARDVARDAIKARTAARKFRERAQRAGKDKDDAHTKAVAALDAARKKTEWADREEARLEAQFQRIKGKGSGLTNAEAAEILAKQKAEGKTEALDQIAKLYRQAMNWKNNLAVDSGLISLEQVADWNKKYPHYADLRGFEDKNLEPEDPYFHGMGGKIEARGPESQQAFGRTSVANNPAVNMMEALHRTIHRAEANRAAQVLYRAAESALKDASDSLDGLLKLDRGDSHWEIDRETGMAKLAQDSRYATSPNAVQVKYDGRARYVVFDDPKLAEDVKRLSPEAIAESARFLQAYQGAAKNLWTHLAPAFVVRHFAGRYPLEAALNAAQYGFGAMMRAFKSYPIFGAYHRAVMSADGMSPLDRVKLAEKVANGTATKKERYMAYYHEMVAEGALMGRNFSDMETIASNLRERLLTLGDVKDAQGLKAKAATAARWAWAKDKAFFEALDHITSNMDSAQRMAAYIEARMRGLSKPQAALEAREATVDFAKRGKYANWAGLYAPFFNVAVQTGARMVGRGGKLKYVIGGVFAAGFASTMLNFLLGGADDDGVPLYEKVAPWQRQSNAAILNPLYKDRKDRSLPLLIPLPYNYALPYNVGQSLAQSMLKAAGIAKKESYGEIAGRAFRSAVEALTPFGSDETWAAFGPGVAQPFLHVLENKSFTGAPLHTDSEWASKSAPYEGKTSTPDYWKWLAQGLNTLAGGNEYNKSALDAYPESLRETLGWVTEAQERTISQTLDAVHALQNGKAPDWGQVPGPNVFMGRADTYDKADEAEFYNRRRDVTDAHKATQAADKAGKSALISQEQREDASLYGSFHKLQGTGKNPGPLGRIDRAAQAAHESDQGAAERWRELQEWSARKADLLHQFMQQKGRRP